MLFVAELFLSDHGYGCFLIAFIILVAEVILSNWFTMVWRGATIMFAEPILSIQIF
jgi:hypothetical protein